MRKYDLSKVTHCKRGHDLSLPGGLRIHDTTGRRQCGACARAYDREYKRKLAAGKDPRTNIRKAEKERTRPEALTIAALTARLLELSDQMWRASMAWERQDIAAEQLRVRAQMDALERGMARTGRKAQAVHS